MKNHIWIFNHYALPPTIPGGTRHFDFARELVKRGQRVTIFSAGFLHGKGIQILNDDEQYRRESYDGVEFFWVKTSSYVGNGLARIKNMLEYSWRVLSVCKMIDAPDIVIGSSVHPFACLAAKMLAQRFGCPYIFEIRDLWPETLVDMGAMRRNGIMAWLLYRLEKYLCLYAKRVIVLMPGAIEYLAGRGIDAQKVVYIPNGVDLNQFSKRYETVVIDKSIDLSRHSGHFKVLYTGSHGPLDSLDTVLDAAQLLKQRGCKDIDFLFFGDGIAKKDLINRAKEMQLDNVYFFDSVRKEQIPRLLAQADILLVSMKNLPIYKYGISFNKMFDYLASSKPIIMTGKVLNDIIMEAGAGISIESENPEQLADTVIAMRNMSSEQRHLMGVRGRRYVEREHDVPVLVSRLQDVLNIQKTN